MNISGPGGLLQTTRYTDLLIDLTLWTTCVLQVKWN